MGNERKVAIITGAGAGVGRCVALTLAKEDYHLMIVGRSEGNTNETAELVRALGAEATPVIADVGSEEDTIRYVNTAVEKYGRIDLFVHNAARFQPFVKLADTDTELFDDIIRINLRGAFLGFKYVLRQMERQQGGVIVCVGSADGLHTDALHGSYSTSKHGVVGLIKNAAVEHGHDGIRVCGVCPGSIQTKMIADILDTMDHKLLGPMQRPADPQEIADVVCYLASDRASYLNGSVVLADGGLSI